MRAHYRVDLSEWWMVNHSVAQLDMQVKIFTRWCKNTKEPWYSDSVVSYLEEQRALVGVLHKDNYLGSFYSFHIFTKGKKWSHTTRMSRSISGIFFVLPCIEAYQKVDLRTITLGVPPQEVSTGQAMMMDNHKRTLTLSSTKFPILNSKWRYMIISLLGEN